MTEGLIDNSAWLAGYAAFERGEGCPWGDESAREVADVTEVTA